MALPGVRVPFIINSTPFISGVVSSFTAFSFFFKGIAISAVCFLEADLNYIAKVRAIQFLTARSGRTVHGKISICRFAEIVFGRETLHEKPCHLARRYNQISPGSSGNYGREKFNNYLNKYAV